MSNRRYTIDLVINQTTGQNSSQNAQLAQQLAAAQASMAQSSQAMGAGLGAASSSMAGLVAGAAALGAVFGGLVTAANAINQAMREADNRQRDWAKEANRGQVGLVQLAGVMGQKAGPELQKEHLAFATTTGLGDKAASFRESFWGRAAQNVGRDAAASRTMSTAHGKDFERRAAEIAVSTGIEPGLVGDLAGAVASRTDWDKEHGDKAPEQAAIQLRQMLAVLQVGAGSNKTLVAQLTRSMAELVRRDKQRGLVQDPVELSAMISAMAERNPASASVYLDRAIETGLFQLDDPKAGKILKAAGVEHGMQPAVAATTLDAFVQKRLKPGQTLEQFLMGHGFDNRQAVGIGGIVDAQKSGLLAQRAAVAAAITPATMQAEREAMENDGVVQIQKAAAAETESGVLRGQVTARVETARQAMLAQLIRDKILGTPESAVALSAFNTRWNPMHWFGYEATEASVTDYALSSRLAKQSGIPGIGVGELFDPVERTERLRQQIEAIDAKGGSLASAVPLLKSIDDSLKSMRRQSEKPAGGNVPLVPQQPGMPRP